MLLGETWIDASTQAPHDKDNANRRNPFIATGAQSVLLREDDFQAMPPYAAGHLYFILPMKDSF